MSQADEYLLVYLVHMYSPFFSCLRMTDSEVDVTAISGGRLRPAITVHMYISTYALLIYSAHIQTFHHGHPDTLKRQG